MDKILNKAVVTQQDLKNERYQGNSFDIGDFDASLGSILQKAPVATVAALFRPYIWESKNAVMLISGLENLFFLAFTIYLLLKIKVAPIFSLVRRNPLLQFSVIFSLIFAFSVGLTTSNFGALVRLRIPLVPFYLSSLFVIKYLNEKKENIET